MNHAISSVALALSYVALSILPQTVAGQAVGCASRVARWWRCGVPGTIRSSTAMGEYCTGLPLAAFWSALSSGQSSWVSPTTRSSGSEVVGIRHVVSVTQISHDNRTAIIFGSHPRPWRNWQTRRI